MNNLQQVVQRAKTDLAKGYVFVHMKGPQLETLLDGLEDLQRKIERLEEERNHYFKIMQSSTSDNERLRQAEQELERADERFGELIRTRLSIHEREVYDLKRERNALCKNLSGSLENTRKVRQAPVPS